MSAFQQKSTTIQKKIQTLTTQVRNSCAIVTHRAEVVEVAGPSQHPANLTKVASRSSLCKMAIESVLDAQIALGHNVHNFAEEPKAIRILLVVGLVVSGCFWILRNDSNVPFVLFCSKLQKICWCRRKRQRTSRRRPKNGFGSLVSSAAMPLIRLPSDAWGVISRTLKPGQLGGYPHHYPVIMVSPCFSMFQ